ncbi:MAG: ribosomal RNA small subunit methyltransferase A [Anaerolineales bacterium]|nr:ribosomal RNA small subunit methyltransferase A [Anaerolineales bacterium]
MSTSSIPPKKSLGQNFLVDGAYLARIVAAADLAPTDLVLEIGPGHGVLTQPLAAAAAGVAAVELDDRLIAPLQATFASQTNVMIVHGDILELEPGAVIDTLAAHLAAASRLPTSIPARQPPYKVVANLPYYITSAVLRQLLEASRPPDKLVLLVQLEVAQRICAAPGDMSLLAISVQYYAEPHFVHKVPAGAFRPAPKVDSAILALDRRATPAVDVAPEPFFRVVRAGFGQKRKQLLNSLAAGLGAPKDAIRSALLRANIDPTRRAETLTLAEWGALCNALSA